MSDLKPSDGQTYAVTLSNGVYDQLAGESGGEPAGGGRNYVLLSASYRVQGDTLVATDSGAPAVTSLAQLKAALAPVAKAKSNIDASETETGR